MAVKIPTSIRRSNNNHDTNLLYYNKKGRLSLVYSTSMFPHTAFQSLSWNSSMVILNLQDGFMYTLLGCQRRHSKCH